MLEKQNKLSWALISVLWCTAHCQSLPAAFLLLSHPGHPLPSFMYQHQMLKCRWYLRCPPPAKSSSSFLSDPTVGLLPPLKTHPQALPPLPRHLCLYHRSSISILTTKATLGRGIWRLSWYFMNDEDMQRYLLEYSRPTPSCTWFCSWAL